MNSYAHDIEDLINLYGRDTNDILNPYGHVIGDKEIVNKVTTIYNQRKKTKRLAFLDASCDLGGIAVSFRQSFPDAVIDIMDHNPCNIEHAKQLPGIKIRNAYEGGPENLRQVVRRTKYDIIIMEGVSWCLDGDEFHAHFNNCKEQLRPGG